MAEILVTGATGLLGTSLVPVLAERHRVVAIARKPPDESAGARWITHDLSRPSLPPDLPESVDVVIHLAQGRAFRDFPARAMETYAVNVASTALLLDWAVRDGARQFILASTGSVYGNTSAPHREDEPLNMAVASSHYAATKLAAEALARPYGSQLSVVVLRLFFMYGRVQERTMLLPRLVDSIAAGRPVSIPGDDGLHFNPIHVSDATRAVVAALALPESCVVNLAGPEILSLREAATLLATRLGTPVKFERQAGPPATDLVGDISTMRSMLVDPRTRLADAADELCSVHGNDVPGNRPSGSS